jgi:hypothetical protein
MHVRVQEVSFVSRGLPFLEYTQRTRELKPDGSLGTILGSLPNLWERFP